MDQLADGSKRKRVQITVMLLIFWFEPVHIHTQTNITRETGKTFLERKKIAISSKEQDAGEGQDDVADLWEDTFEELKATIEAVL